MFTPRGIYYSVKDSNKHLVKLNQNSTSAEPEYVVTKILFEIRIYSALQNPHRMKNSNGLFTKTKHMQ